MDKTRREQVKALIELSTTFEETDEVIEKYAKLKTVKEKIAFLQGMFDWEIFDQEKTDSDEITYAMVLNGIISKKWDKR